MSMSELKDGLQRVFGLQEFRPLQEDVCRAVMAGTDMDVFLFCIRSRLNDRSSRSVTDTYVPMGFALSKLVTCQLVSVAIRVH